MIGQNRRELTDQARRYLEHAMIKMRKWVAEAEAWDRTWENEKSDYMLRTAEKIARERRESPVHEVDIKKMWEGSPRADAIIAANTWAHRKANTYAQAALAEKAWIDHLNNPRN